MDIQFDELSTPCNCEGRGFYTRAEVDAMLQNIVDPDTVNAILDQMFEDYISGSDLETLIINTLGNVYSQDQIDAMFAAETARTENTYATEAYVDAAITAATADLPSKNWVVGHTSLALAPIYDILNSLQAQITACCGGEPDTGDTPTYDYTIEVTYNVTSTTNYTPIVNNIAGIVSIETAGGVDVPVNVVYRFPATGNQKLVFTFSGTASSEKFRGLNNIVDAKVGKDIYLSYGNFMENTSLTGVTFVAGSKTPSTTQFYGDTGLASVSGIETSNWTTIPIYLFSGCTSLTQDITLPDSILTIERQAFAYAPVRNLTIPAGIQSIDYDAITHITGYVRFKGEVPPFVSMEGDLVNFRGNYPIYVPASAVDVYKSVLPEVASRIQAWS